MDDQKRKLIITEIESWRKNHLLPEHYCIFLLNLYTEGDRPVGKSKTGSQTSGRGSQVSGIFSQKAGYVNDETASDYQFRENGVVVRSSISWKMIWYWLLGACVIAGLILLAFHFNGFSTLMQIAISSIFILITYILSLALRRKSPALTHVSLAISFFLLILAGVYFIKEMGLSQTVLLIFIAFICLLWCLNGLIFRFSYLLYIGILGFGILYGYVTTNRLEEHYTWWLAELYWVPFAVLMIGFGFLLHERNPQLSGVLAFCGTILLYGSEISSLYVTEAKRDIIQLLLFIKVFLNSGFIFFTRSYWFRWLRL